MKSFRHPNRGRLLRLVSRALIVAFVVALLAPTPAQAARTSVEDLAFELPAPAPSPLATTPEPDPVLWLLIVGQGQDLLAWFVVPDPELAGNYHRARWMDPSIGRFAGMDPFRVSGSDPLVLHKYLYGSVDPVNRIDPSGESPTVAQVAAVGAIIGALAANAIVQPKSVTQSVQVTVVGAALGALVAGGAAYWALGGSVVGAAATAGGGGATTAAIGAAPRVLESEALVAGRVALPHAADRLWLGHWGYRGFQFGGERIVGVSKAGLQYLETMAERFGGRTLGGYPANFDMIRKQIDAADQIVFNVTRLQPYMASGNPTMTWMEIQYITANSHLYAKTIFVSGGTF